MLIAGAGGHAKEILDILLLSGETDICFYDDINRDMNLVFQQYPVLHSAAEAKAYFNDNGSGFVLGVGSSAGRKKLATHLGGLGGTLQTILAPTSYISLLDVHLGPGINIMHRCIVQPSVRIGEGTLMNAGTMIHHDSHIGAWCEICPSVTVTGGCTIGDNCFLGTGAIIAPNVQVGNSVIIGAGSIVRQHLPDGARVAGNPAKHIIPKNTA